MMLKTRRNEPEWAADARQVRAGLYVGAYSFDMSSHPNPYPKSIVYRFVAGLPAALHRETSFANYPSPTVQWGAELVSSKPVPRIWRDDVSYASRLQTSERADIGYIVYQIYREKALAVTNEYYPKDNIQGRYLAISLPYFLEAISTADLMRSGIEYISTSDRPKFGRIRQLAQVGLVEGEKTPVRDWLMAMGRGIRQHLAIEERSRTVGPTFTYAAFLRA